MSTIVTTDELATYMGLVFDSVQEDRAQMLIDDAIDQALSVVTVGAIPDSGPTEANLPNGAAGVIRAALERRVSNPNNVITEAAGPYAIGRTAGSGAIFSTAERGQLRRFAGRGSAFTIDPLAGYPDSVFPPTVPVDQ